MTYRIKRVDDMDDEIADTIHWMHKEVFWDTAPAPDTDQDFWWLAYQDKMPCGFAQVVPAASTPNTGYLKRSGVLPGHRGNRLQLRLIRAREALARKMGWVTLVTDTTDNPRSANTMIRAGYRLYTPENKWAYEHSLYWRKTLHG